jgi:hypothetical protein
MALRPPRDGINAGFHMLPDESYEGTLGDPEKILWASLRHMCARDVATEVLHDVHNIKRRSDLKKVSNNLKVYIEQAYNFYRAAQQAETATSPLIYYYSFLNLAKALSEIRYPGFHKHPESYRHGLTWKPNKEYLVNLETETVNISTRGVWHTLIEAASGNPVVLSNPLPVKIKELFALCPETSIEFQRTFSKPTRLVELIDAGIFLDTNKKELWIRLSVKKNNLKELKLTRPKFIRLITSKGFYYEQVKSEDYDTWVFESVPTIQYNTKETVVHFKFVEPLINPINLFVHMRFDEIGYMVPLQDKLPIRLPQLLVLYTLMFWLGSLVRYDPHSVDNLLESRHSILIDGYMNQSRIWLLELFEWYFYRTDTTLRSVR